MKGCRSGKAPFHQKSSFLKGCLSSKVVFIFEVVFMDKIIFIYKIIFLFEVVYVLSSYLRLSSQFIFVSIKSFIVTTPTQPQLNSKVGFAMKMTLHHHPHHHPPPTTTTRNSTPAILPHSAPSWIILYL